MRDLSCLAKSFETFNNEKAIVWNEGSFSYGELSEKINAWIKKLSNEGIGRGETIAFSGDYSPETVSLLLALIANGNIAVPLPPVLKKKDEKSLDLTDARKFIIFKNDGSIVFKNIKKRNRVHPFIAKLRSQKTPGLILFSSGSTGAPKAILHDFRRLLARYDGKGKKLVTIPFLFLDHIGGINTLLYTLSNGGRLVIVKDRNPNEVCRMIDTHGVELLPTSPTFLNLLLISEAHKAHDLSSLKLISYGTEVMPKYLLRRMSELFPKTRLIQTYGLSELGILSSKSRSSSSLWMKVGGGGYKTKIVNNELWIKSSFSMVGYLNAPTPFDETGWFNTGDLVEKDKRGNLRIIGRRTDIINVGGQKVNPVEVEDIIMKMKEVDDVTVFGEKNPILGNIVVAKVRLKSSAKQNIMNLRQEIRAFCAEHLPLYKVPARVIFVELAEISSRLKKVRLARGK